MNGNETNIAKEPGVKIDRDLTSKVVGDFGKWQMQISVMMALLKLPAAWYQLNIIFLAPHQDFWCEEIINHKHNNTCYGSTSMASKNATPIECTKFVYDKSVFSRTIVSEWDLVCSKHWLVQMSQFVLMWGILLGALIFGALADKFGRKIPLMSAIIIQCIAGLISSVIPCFWGFMVNRFFLALASGGIGVISFVICMEIVGGKWRTTVPILSQLPYSAGNTVMASLAYWLRDWRKLEFALATLSSIFVLYWFFIPESPRWLLAKGQSNKAIEVLKRGAILNRRDFKECNIALLISKSKSSSTVEPKITAFLKSRNMRLKILLLSIHWFCTGLSFYTFSQYLGSIGSNIFITVLLSGVISMPGAIACVVFIRTFGRKTIIASFQLLTACCFILLLFIPKNRYINDWPRLICAGFGLGGMAGSVPALFLFSGELFPTIGRNIGVGSVSMFARVGSMVAPFLVSLDSTLQQLPLVILAILSFSQILLLIPLPETKDCPLPDNIEQAEMFGRELDRLSNSNIG